MKFEKAKRMNFKKDILIGIIIISLLCNLIFIQPSSHGIEKTTFSSGDSEIIIEFPAGGEIIDSLNISITNGTTISHATMNITSMPNAGQYPSNVFLDIGRDGDYEWVFDGKGYGSMGYQSFFKNGKTSIIKTFTGTPGEKLETKIRIPKKSEIESASMNIRGQITELIKSTTISSTIGQVYNCEVGDIDGDNDLDAIIAYYSQTSPNPTVLSWYENSLGDGSSWTSHSIATTGLLYPYGLAVGDLDGDNDLDVVVSDNTWNSRDIFWYNNTNGLGTSWTVHTIRASIPGTSVYIYNLALADMNDDSYIDVVGTLSNTDNTQEDVYWYSNVYGNGSTWLLNTINKTIIGARGIYIEDIDGDGDNDTAVTVIPTSGTDQVLWFSNDDGAGTLWTGYLLDNTFSDPFAVVIADIDNDNNPDLAIIGGSNTVWFEAPNDPTIVSNWKLHNIGVGGNWGGDIAVADIGYNNINKEPDNNLDIIIVGRLSNEVIIYKNDGTPLDGGWVRINLNTNHRYANWLTMGDLDGDTYIDTLAASSLWSTTDDLIWYKLNGGAPTNVQLKLGPDPQADWVEAGVLDTNVQIPDFSFNLTQYIGQGTSKKDDYGNEFVSIPIEITSDSAGLLTLNQMNIKYNYTATVGSNPNGDLAKELTKALSTITPGPDGNCTVPFRFISSSAGKLLAHDLVIEYNLYPWFTQELPEVLKLPEDSLNPTLMDLSNYVNDDYLSPTKLGYNVSYLKGPGVGKVDLIIDNNHYLSADALTGTSNDNWTGYLDFKINVTDNFGSTIESDIIKLKITPVNDEPILGTDKYPDLVFAEGQSSKSFDLDSRDYFMDPDFDPLYFSIVIDPNNEIKDEIVSFNLDSETNILTFNGGGDWYGSDLPVTIYCDDSKPVNLSLAQHIRISVVNINDPPVWKQIPDIILDEDFVADDYLNLLDFIDDIDDSNEHLTFGIVSNSNPDPITVIVDKNNNIDINSNIPEFVGSTIVTLRVTDSAQNYSETTVKISYQPVNDQPAVEIKTPIDNSIVESDSAIISWQSFDSDTPSENLIFTVYLSESLPPSELATEIKGNQYIASELIDELNYYCQIKVTDGETSGMSSIISFTVDISKQPEIGLINPKSNAVFTEPNVLFEWKVTVNANDLDLTYELYLNKDENALMDEPYKSGITGTQYIIKDIEPDQSYYWTIIPRFDSGYGICKDGTQQFSIDPSGSIFGLELIPSISELKIKHGEEEIFTVEVKNIGLNEEEISLVITPKSINNNIQLNVPKTTLTIGSKGKQTIRFTLKTENIVPGEYQISIAASSIVTPAFAQENISLNVLGLESEKEKEEKLFEDITSWLPILIIIVIGIIGAVIIGRKKPKEDDLSFEDALDKGLKRDLRLQKPDILYGPSFEPVGGEYQPQTVGIPQVPSMGPARTTATTGPLPQLPPRDTTAYEPIESESSTEPQPDLDLVSGPELTIESDLMEGPKVLLPDEVESLKELEQIEPITSDIDQMEESIPEIELPEPVREPSPELLSVTTGPEFGESLKLEKIEPDESYAIEDDVKKNKSELSTEELKDIQPQEDETSKSKTKKNQDSNMN